MTDNTKKLDIAQRIVEAMQRSSEPSPSADGQLEPAKDTVIGEVPEHLRHLHNLLDEIGNEAQKAERRFRTIEKRYAAVHTIFFEALKQHVPYEGSEYNGVKVCTDWHVVGFKHKED